MARGGRKAKHAREMKRGGGYGMTKRGGKKKTGGKKGGKGRQDFIDRGEDALGDMPL